ncbi:MAG: calcium/sodium antiporter [Leucothrix sp.]
MEQMVLYSSAVIAGLVLLAWSSDRFVDGASGIAQQFGISPLVIGLTIVAFSTSAPEMLVSAISAWQGNNGIAIGNAIGSNIANMTLVLGISALILPLSVGPQTLHREVPLLLTGMLFALGVLLWDDELSRIDGLLLMAAMIVSVWYTLFQARQHSFGARELATVSMPQTTAFNQLVWLLISGLLVLLVSAKMLVWGAVGIAQSFGISDLVIGLTIVAVGTSLPELAASISAIRKGQHDIAVGNVVGSSLFNILAVLGIVGVVGPNPLDPSVIVRDYPLMLGLIIVFYLCTRTTPKDQSFTLKRWVGGALLVLFFAYQTVILLVG